MPPGEGARTRWSVSPPQSDRKSGLEPDCWNGRRPLLQTSSAVTAVKRGCGLLRQRLSLLALSPDWPWVNKSGKALHLRQASPAWPGSVFPGLVRNFPPIPRTPPKSKPISREPLSASRRALSPTNPSGSCQGAARPDGVDAEMIGQTILLAAALQGWSPSRRLALSQLISGPERNRRELCTLCNGIDLIGSPIVSCWSTYPEGAVAPLSCDDLISPKTGKQGKGAEAGEQRAETLSDFGGCKISSKGSVDTANPPALMPQGLTVSCLIINASGSTIACDLPTGAFLGLCDRRPAARAERGSSSGHRPGLDGGQTRGSGAAR